MIRNIAFIIASILSLKTMALRCESLFDRTLPQKTSTRSALEKYKVNYVTLEKISARLPEERLKHLEHLVAATEFFDYAHFSEKLLDVYLKNENKKVNLSRLYDEGVFLVGESKPFQGFLNARKFLAIQTREPSIDLIKDIHRIVMAGEVEGVVEKDLGDLRDAHWYGGVSKGNAITESEKAHISENPYLTFEAAGTTSAAFDSKKWNNISFWGKNSEKNSNIEKILHLGKIHYPNILHSKQATIDLIQQSHPELYKKIVDIRQRKEVPTYFEGSELKDLEDQMTVALTQNRIDQFNQHVKLLGAVKAGLNEKEYINLVADFQRDLVSIHPVKNGNGRTTRLLMNYLLNRAGLPSARVLDPSMDIQKSQAEWRDIVLQGVRSSAKLYEDFKERVQNGLLFEDSPELLFPGLPEKVEISFKKQGSEKVYLGTEPVKVNAEQFTAFLKELVKAHPELAQQIKSDRIRSMNMISEMFIDFYKSKTIEYMHEKEGRSIIKLRFVESDFMDMFGVIRSPHKHLWKYKMNRWYNQDMLIWRGLSGRTEVSDAEILNYFIHPSDRIASNATVSAARRGKDLKKSMLEDFDKYNKELLSGKLIELADDHHKEGPRYSESYGFSTSKREVVGKAFAMGAMVIAEYGQQNNPELQKQLKSRINIASYRAEKDVDLGRLKAFDSKFSYIYGRQAEVMAIGGTDPDAVMLIQRISETGDVEKTYYRNPQQPNEILVIQGRYVPEMGLIPKNQILSKRFINYDSAKNKVTVESNMTEANNTYFKNIKYTPEVKPVESSQNVIGESLDRAKKWFGGLFE